MATYFDYVLGLIPLLLFGTTGALFVFGLSLSLAASAGGLISAVMIGHAVFVRGPRDAPSAADPSSIDYTPGGD